jgi:hypothetical protein
MIIQYARKPGLAHNQRWTYQNGYIFPTSAPHLVLDIRVNKQIYYKLSVNLNQILLEFRAEKRQFGLFK